MPYVYEPRPRKGMQQPKHKWGKPAPGFTIGAGGEKVGMCPAGIPQETLEQLLNSGIFVYAKGGDGEHPKAIFNIHEGVPYRAVKTLKGKSFHGFPCLTRSEIPPKVLKQLMERAAKQGVEAEVDEWFKQVA